MRLRVITPARTCIDRKVAVLRAEAPDGEFGLLPRHGDFVTQLVPGILSYAAADGARGEAIHHVAVNSGALMKFGGDVTVAVRGAIAGDRLEDLRRQLDSDFRRQDEEERGARSALARLEASMERHLRELERVER
ncbi:F0F1 ATP synthase subunit epsilon [Oceanibium sediminis]|uniref:F0F1 ATP synthase subunit epsilon n=1 Tax=Oceanibium sediminis TaxID=2026339 RepID=UPI001300B3A3|nr:F0F1 ATP synthase subunit epsilon [Oceanibium sediminis]